MIQKEKFCKSRFEIRIEVPEDIHTMLSEISGYYLKSQGYLCYPPLVKWIKKEYYNLKPEIEKEKL